MHAFLGNLILDGSAVVEACQEPESNTGLLESLNRVREAGVEIWIYTAEVTSILSSFADSDHSGTHDQPADGRSKPESRLKAFVRGCQWLATLSEDFQDLDCPDPLQAALIRASSRLGDNATILTFSPDRLSVGPPFIALSDLPALPPEKQVSFIDLRRQQNRIRPSLESGIHRILHHGRFVAGSEIGKLESELAQYAGVEHCICVSSGTDALLAALMAIDIKPGDEVITSSFTFFATAETIVLLGGVPIYVDIDPGTFNLDPSRIEAAISSRTRAIMPVSLYGQCAEMDEINAIARRHSLTVIEDAAQSFGATYHSRHSCALTDLACTSFFPAKPLGAYGDGGACFTHDASLATRLRQIRDHGQDGRYHHVRLGINGRLDTIQAAVLNAKLKIFSDEIAARQKVADRYAELLADLAGAGCITLPVVRPHNTSAWAQYTIRVADRDEIQQRLTEQGIPSAVHYPAPLYDQPALARSGEHCPESDRAAKEVLSLPMHPYLDEAMQVRVSQALHEVARASASVPSQPDVAEA